MPIFVEIQVSMVPKILFSFYIDSQQTNHFAKSKDSAEIGIHIHLSIVLVLFFLSYGL